MIGIGSPIHILHPSFGIIVLRRISYRTLDDNGLSALGFTCIVYLTAAVIAPIRGFVTLERELHRTTKGGVQSERNNNTTSGITKHRGGTRCGYFLHHDD